MYFQNTDSHIASDFRIFQMPQDGEWLPRVALRFTLGYEPVALLGRSFFQNALLVVIKHRFPQMNCLYTDLHNVAVLIGFNLLNLCEIKLVARGF